MPDKPASPAPKATKAAGVSKAGVSKGRRGDAERTPSADELRLLLQEQVEANVELDAEVAYLQAELKIKNEYLDELEIEIGRLHVVAAEYAEYRSRIAHRAVDGVVVRVTKMPMLYEPMRVVGRSVLRGRSRSSEVVIEVSES